MWGFEGRLSLVFLFLRMFLQNHSAKVLILHVDVCRSQWNPSLGEHDVDASDLGTMFTSFNLSGPGRFVEYLN